MKIKSEELLSVILNVSKVNKNSIALESIEGSYARLQATSSEAYITQYVNIHPDEELIVGIPVSIIPVLSEIKNKIVDIDFIDNRCTISWNNSNINLNLPHFNVEELVRDNYTPSFTNKLPRLSNMRYACGNEKDTMDVFFFVGNGIVTGDKFRFCVYKPLPSLLLDGVVISEKALQYLPSDITPSIDQNSNRVYLGDEKCIISVPTIEKPIPAALYSLFEHNIDRTKYIALSAKDLIPMTNIAHTLSKKDDGYGFISLIMSNGNLSIVPGGNSYGNGVLMLESTEYLGEFDLKVNPGYFASAIKECKSAQVVLGVSEFAKTTLLYIYDNELTHYILPMYG